MSKRKSLQPLFHPTLNDIGPRKHSVFSQNHCFFQFHDTNEYFVTTIWENPTHIISYMFINSDMT